MELMSHVDVLIGVTGSGLSNLAFMRAGSMVLELASPIHLANYFVGLVNRVHGHVARGVLTYRRVLFEPMNWSVDDGEPPPLPSDLDAYVNVSAVVQCVLGEYERRIAFDI